MNPYLPTLTPVWKDAQHVHINWRSLRTCIRDLLSRDLPAPAWAEEIFPHANDSRFVEFLGVLNAVNAYFTGADTAEGAYDVIYPRGSGRVYHGSAACAAALKRALDEGVPVLDPPFLAALETGCAARIFEPATTPLPLFEERCAHLREVGSVLVKERLTFVEIFRAAEYRCFRADGAGIVEAALDLFPKAYGGDVSWFGAHRVAFHKRAQLLPMMYHGRAVNSKGALPAIRDPENFGPICDDVIPAGFREDGVLVYDDSLSEKIARGEPLGSGSPEETEIRGKSAEAMMWMLACANDFFPAFGRRVTMAEVDSARFRAWRNTPPGKLKFRRHRHTPSLRY